MTMMKMRMMRWKSKRRRRRSKKSGSLCSNNSMLLSRTITILYFSRMLLSRRIRERICINLSASLLMCSLVTATATITTTLTIPTRNKSKFSRFLRLGMHYLQARIRIISLMKRISHCCWIMIPRRIRSFMGTFIRTMHSRILSLS